MNTGIRAKAKLMIKAGVWVRAAGLAAVLVAGGCRDLIMRAPAAVRFVSVGTVELFESTVGADFVIPSFKHPRKGYAFDGWKAESGEVCWPEQSIKVDQTVVTFTAKFLPTETEKCYVQYCEYYVKGDSPNKLPPYGYPFDAEVRIEDVPDLLLTADDGDHKVSFLGWRTEGGTRLVVGELLSPHIQEDVRLYAVYSTQPHKIWYLQGESDGGKAPDVQSAFSTFIPAGRGDLSKGDCLFDGWKNAAGAIYKPGVEYLLSGNLTLSPVWLSTAAIR